MNRKSFISSVIPLGAIFSDITRGKLTNDDPNLPPKVPPYLKRGDIIGICCVAGYISSEDVQPCINKLKDWDFDVKIGNTIGKKDFTFGGTDEERLNDFQQMLNDKKVKAIMCARGGYGSVRIIDRINFTNFIAHPKWIIGFSDVTVLHCHINRNYGIATLHSKMCNSFPTDWNNAEEDQKEAIESIQKALIGEKAHYTADAVFQNKQGTAEGILVGGNLRTIETLAGTASNLSTNGKILFVEETDEYLYSVDRMFWNLKRTGKLSSLKGLIIGGFKLKKDDPGEEFGKTVEEIVLEKVKEYNYPVCFGFPVGHQVNNIALKCGIKHKLVVNSTESILTEIRS